MLPKVTTLRGYPVEIDGRIGGGGEGDVYRVIGNPTRVAKIWHPRMRRDRQIAKIKRMCRIKPTLHINSNPVLAWPEEPILERGSVIGYTMPMVQDHFTLYDCQTPARSRNNNLPIYGAEIPRLASRIANIFTALHVNQCFIGDVNPQNILIRRGSLVPILIDCDSFQIDNPEFPDFPFLSSVVTPEYRAPERTQSDVRIDASVDVFGLAVIVYQLLLGEHPFSGIDDNSPYLAYMPTLAGRIADGRFAHTGDVLWHPRTNEVKQSWEALPQPVRNVLTQALDYHQFGRHRPTAKRISEVIRTYQSQLAAIPSRFSGYRSSSPGTSSRSPYMPQTVASRRTQMPKVSTYSATRKTHPHTTSTPERNQGGESQESLWAWLWEHSCIILLIAIFVGFVIFNMDE